MGRWMPLCVLWPSPPAPRTSHTVWEGAIGERTDMILGHEAVGEIVEVKAAW